MKVLLVTNCKTHSGTCSNLSSAYIFEDYAVCEVIFTMTTHGGYLKYLQIPYFQNTAL